jgi:hypothetical protein
MVLLVVSYQTERFCIETTTSESMEVITVLCARLHNARLRARRLAGHMGQLAKYGPMRVTKEIGLNRDQVLEMGNKSKLGPEDDPLLARVGIAPSTQAAKTLTDTAAELLAYVDNKQADIRVCIDEKTLDEKYQNCKGAVMIAYPMKLPDNDVILDSLENSEDLNGMEDSKYVMDEKTCALWFAGKQLMREDVLSKRLGSNEKVTLKVKLAPRGNSAPAREVDEDARKKMYQMYHKKMQQEKELQADDDNDYMNSTWADPSAYKKSMQGLGNIRF